MPSPSRYWPERRSNSQLSSSLGFQPSETSAFSAAWAPAGTSPTSASPAARTGRIRIRSARSIAAPARPTTRCSFHHPVDRVDRAAADLAVLAITDAHRPFQLRRQLGGVAQLDLALG